MTYFKNIHFTKLIKVNGRAREFNFRKKNSGAFPVYEIDVSDEKGERHYFTMELKNGIWAIPEKNIPDWLVEQKEEIDTAIKEQEN